MSSASGILRPNEVIYYHPLDNGNIEFTTQDIWQGLSQNVQGKIGQAESAISSTELQLPPLVRFFRSDGLAQSGQNLRLKGYSESGVIAFYGSIGVDRTARLGLVSGTTIDWQNEVIVSNENSQADSEQTQNALAVMDSTHVLFVYSNSNSPGPQGGYVKVGTISGSTLTLGDPIQFVTSVRSEIRAGTLDSTHAFVLYHNGATTKVDAKIFTRTGTSGSFGSDSSTSITSDWRDVRHTLDLAVLTPTKVLIAARSSGMMVNAVVSGDNITWGIPQAISGFDTTPDAALYLETVDATHAIFSNFISTGAPTAPLFETGLGINPVFMLEVSGDAITRGPSIQLPATTIDGIELTALDSNNILFAYTIRTATTDGFARAGILNVSGMNLIIGSTILYGDFLTSAPPIARLTDSKFVLSAPSSRSLGPNQAGDISATPGKLALAADISGISSFYPTVIGNTRAVHAFWTKNLSPGLSTVSFDRGYKFIFSSGNIAVQQKHDQFFTYWSGSTVVDFLNIMNDGSDHLAVIDLYRVAGGSHNTDLNTSADGQPFIFHGTQPAEMLGSTPDEDRNPSIVINNGLGISQWIDEAVFWGSVQSGTLPQFTNTELYNLHLLADRFDLTMDQYSSGPPFFEYSSIRLVLGSGIPSLNNINHYTKTSDYNPELIGDFSSRPASVNIEVWDIIDAENIKMTIQNSGCHNIGMGDKWGWSIEPAIISSQRKKYHYFFRMIANDNTEQTGEFFITVPEHGRWSYPDRREEWLGI